MSRRSLMLGFAIVSALAPAAMGQSILTPTAISHDYVELFGPNFGAGNLIDQSGLAAGYVSGVTDFDTYVATTGHTNGNADMMLCNSNGQNQPNGIVNVPANITLDLGSEECIDGLALWNTDFSGEALSSFDLYADNDDNFGNGTTGFLGSYAAASTAAGEAFSFNAALTRYVHVRVTGHGGGSFLRLGEFAVRACDLPVPVSSSTPWGLILLSVALVGAAGLLLRRRLAD